MQSLDFVDIKTYPDIKFTTSKKTKNHILIVHEDIPELNLILTGLQNKFKHTSIIAVKTIDEAILRLVQKEINGDKYLIFSQYAQIHYAYQNYPGLFRHLITKGIIFTNRKYLLKTFLSINN